MLMTSRRKEEGVFDLVSTHPEKASWCRGWCGPGADIGGLLFPENTVPRSGGTGTLHVVHPVSAPRVASVPPALVRLLSQTAASPITFRIQLPGSGQLESQLPIIHCVWCRFLRKYVFSHHNVVGILTFQAHSGQGLSLRSSLCTYVP